MEQSKFSAVKIKGSGTLKTVKSSGLKLINYFLFFEPRASCSVDPRVYPIPSVYLGYTEKPALKGLKIEDHSTKCSYLQE